MNPIDLKCPPNFLPPNVSIRICLGLIGVPADGEALWYQIEVENGTVTSSQVALGDPKHRPTNDFSPDLLFTASYFDWQTASEGAEQLAKLVATGAISIAGDYRVFGRYTPVIIRALLETKLWSSVDRVVEYVRRTEISRTGRS